MPALRRPYIHLRRRLGRPLQRKTRLVPVRSLPRRQQRDPRRGLGRLQDVQDVVLDAQLRVRGRQRAGLGGRVVVAGEADGRAVAVGVGQSQLGRAVRARRVARDRPVLRCQRHPEVVGDHFAYVDGQPAVRIHLARYVRVAGVRVAQHGARRDQDEGRDPARLDQRLHPVLELQRPEPVLRGTGEAREHLDDRELLVAVRGVVVLRRQPDVHLAHDTRDGALELGAPQTAAERRVVDLLPLLDHLRQRGDLLAAGAVRSQVEGRVDMVRRAEQVVPAVIEAIGVVDRHEHHQDRRGLREEHHEQPAGAPHQGGSAQTAPEQQRQQYSDHDQADRDQEEGVPRQIHHAEQEVNMAWTVARLCTSYLTMEPKPDVVPWPIASAHAGSRAEVSAAPPTHATPPSSPR
ncbi:hypothetical protein QFZ67_003021 [Streptomyces sp. V1I1]|nr:hypothetical protein [Streptomyces sp. V1I1]